MVMKTFEVVESFRERPQGFTYMEIVESMLEHRGFRFTGFCVRWKPWVI